MRQDAFGLLVKVQEVLLSNKVIFVKTVVVVKKNPISSRPYILLVSEQERQAKH